MNAANERSSPGGTANSSARTLLGRTGDGDGPHAREVDLARRTALRAHRAAADGSAVVSGVV
jgi:hypothetical protein